MTCITAANGKVTYTYTGAAAGDDTINAAITVDGSTQTATAAKTWVDAPPTGSVEGKGTYATGKECGRVSFSVDADADGGTFDGRTGTNDHFEATSVAGFTQAGNTASFSGNAEVDGDAGYTYTVSFVDNGFPGRNDTISIVIKDSGGAVVFDSHGPQLLKTGNVDRLGLTADDVPNTVWGLLRRAPHTFWGRVAARAPSPLKGDLAATAVPEPLRRRLDRHMLTNDTHPSSSAVRLIERHGNVPSGTLGRVIGRFARENPTYLVSFRKEGVLELRGDEIASAA